MKENLSIMSSIFIDIFSKVPNIWNHSAVICATKLKHMEQTIFDKKSLQGWKGDYIRR